MFISAAHKFLEHLRVVKNASVHTIRNYSIDLNEFKHYLESLWHADAKPESLPEKIYFEKPRQQRNSQFDSLFPFKILPKKQSQVILLLLL